MSEKYHKTFISAREFVESWDKEIYELTNLDFFIYLLVNHLGNQLDSHFFRTDKKESRLHLNFENIGTLCFNLGDSFEYFLRSDRNPQKDADINYERDELADPQENEEKMIQRIRTLKSFLSDGVIREQDFRVELMEHVVIDTLLQFYSEEIGVEFDEDDLELIELADFIEDVIIEFIRKEGGSLLQHPGDPAIDHFEELLDGDESFSREEAWEEQEEDIPGEGEWVDEENFFEPVEEVVKQFLESNRQKKKNRGLEHDALFDFQEFLVDHSGVTNIFEVGEEHLLEFFTIFTVQKFVHVDSAELDKYFHILARFFFWLNSAFGLDFRESFKRNYRIARAELPRIVDALNQYLEEYDLLEVLLNRDNPDVQQLSSFFEVQRIRSKFSLTLDLEDLRLNSYLENIRFPASIHSRLKPGDILQATLIQRDQKWEVLELHFLYPKHAKPFLS